MYAFMYVCMHVCMYVCTHVHTYEYVCMPLNVFFLDIKYMYFLYVGFDYTYIDINALAQGIKCFVASQV